MKLSEYIFKFTIFGKKVQLFQEGDMGIVIEKARDVVCIYGTSGDNRTVYCATPLGSPRLLSGIPYTVTFYDNQVATVQVGRLHWAVDFGKQKCCNDQGLQNYGSEEWGEQVTMPWKRSYFA